MQKWAAFGGIVIRMPPGARSSPPIHHLYWQFLDSIVHLCIHTYMDWLKVTLILAGNGKQEAKVIWHRLHRMHRTRCTRSRSWDMSGVAKVKTRSRDPAPDQHMPDFCKVFVRVPSPPKGAQNFKSLASAVSEIWDAPYATLPRTTSFPELNPGQTSPPRKIRTFPSPNKLLGACGSAVVPCHRSRHFVKPMPMIVMLLMYYEFPFCVLVFNFCSKHMIGHISENLYHGSHVNSSMSFLCFYAYIDAGGIMFSGWRGVGDSDSRQQTCGVAGGDTRLRLRGVNSWRRRSTTVWRRPKYRPAEAFSSFYMLHFLVETFQLILIKSRENTLSRSSVAHFQQLLKSSTWNIFISIFINFCSRVFEFCMDRQIDADNK